MKKRFMRMISMLLAFVMTLCMCVTGFAEGDEVTYSITVKNSIGGVEYNVYKVFDVSYSDDGSAITYTIDESSPWYPLMSGDNAGSCPFILTQSALSETTYVVTAKTPAEGTAEAAIAAWFNGLESLPEGVEAAADPVQGDGTDKTFDLEEPGYYLVVPSVPSIPSAAVSLTTAAPEAEIVDKNQKPGEGGEGKNLTKDADGESYSIGDTVSYKISSYVPTYDDDLQVIDYTFTDTMGKGLTLVAELDETSDPAVVTSGVTVKIDGTNLDVGVEITQYCTITVSESTDDGTILTIHWNIEDVVLDNDLTYPADAVVTITYEALVNEAADETDLSNNVSMKWNVKTPDGSEEEEGPTPPEVTVYTYGFTLNKTDDGEGDAAKPLDGAVFTLKKQNDDSNITFIYDEETKTYEVYDGQGSTGDGEPTDKITVYEGTVNIWGLGEGTYILTEVETPDGYNPLNEPITIVIAPTTETVDEQVTVTGWTVTVNGSASSNGTFMSVNGTADEHGIGDMAAVTVVNVPGTLLPGTGGIGTVIFYVAGTLLILAAAALVVTKWRLGRAE